MTTLAVAWALRRLRSGGDLGEELETVPEPFRSMAALLARVPVDKSLRGRRRQEALASARAPLWDAMMAARQDRDELVRAMDGVDPEGPCPTAEPRPRCATLADVRRLVADDQWAWNGWIARGVLNALASDPGVGKTICAADLARRLWHGLPWPDGQPNPLPAGTRTLWVPGDQHYPQLLGLAEQFGIPPEAMLLNAPGDDPTAGLDMDDLAELDALAGRIAAEGPGLVTVDTVGMTTSRNLCRPEDARDYFTPLMEIARRTGVPFLLLTHLSRDGQALGRRISGACRLVWKMTHPDPDGDPDRRRLWVEKSYAEKPRPLGMTIGAKGCDFDLNPPSAPETARPGRPPSSREKAAAFIRTALRRENDRTGNDLCDEWEEEGGSDKTFWRAVDSMKAEEALSTDGGRGTGRPTVLHLTRGGPGAAPDGAA